jgi:hypothetical protein
MPERFWSPYLAASSEHRRLTAIEHPIADHEGTT